MVGVVSERHAVVTRRDGQDLMLDVAKERNKGNRRQVPSLVFTLTCNASFEPEGVAECITNENGEQQIACALAFRDPQDVRTLNDHARSQYRNQRKRRFDAQNTITYISSERSRSRLSILHCLHVRERRQRLQRSNTTHRRSRGITVLSLHPRGFHICLDHALGSRTFGGDEIEHEMHPMFGSRGRHPPTFVPWGLHNEDDRMTIVPSSRRTTKLVETSSSSP
jgi:hypothetical protein